MSESINFQWYKIFESPDELPIYKSIIITIENAEICIFRTHNGYWAIENKCPHQQLPLSGAICTDDDEIICAFHHMAISLHTGICNNRSYKPAKIYAIQQRADGIFVEV